MTENINLDVLADKIAKRLIEQNSYLITVAGVAAMLGYTAESIPVRRILADKTFPAPVSLVDRGVRRWRRKDVQAWIDQRAGDIGRASRVEI